MPGSDKRGKGIIMEPAATRKPALRRASAAAFGILIAILSLSPSPGNMPPTFPHTDKLVHFGLYALLMFLLQRALAPAMMTCKRSIMLLAGCSIYGMLLELGQHTWVYLGRTGSLADILANTAGAATVAMVMHYHRTSLNSEKPPTCTTGLET
jgi:VanZ family protein